MTADPVAVRATEPPMVREPFYSDARARLQADARQFTDEFVKPLAADLDPRKAEMPRGLIEQMAQMGYFGVLIPREFGGMGLGVFEYCLISEELARGWMSVASIIARAQGLGTSYGTAEERRARLEKSAQGLWIGAAALSEPGAGSDLAAVATTASRDGDDYVIHGTKRWAGNAKAADFIQLLCRTRNPELGEPRSAGLITLVIEKDREAFPSGVSGTLIDKIGYHGFTTWQLTFDGLRVPVAHEVHELISARAGSERQETSTFRAIEQGLNIARVHTAARAVGLARAAVEDTAVYLQGRQQFGSPLADFQSLRFTLATMAARVEQARSFYQHVACLVDLGQPCEQEAAMVKLLATEMAVDVTSDAMQLHGGNGYTTEYQVERYWRDARLTTIFEGTSQIQQKIISDRLLPHPKRSN